MKNHLQKDTRLLEALDHIDSDLIGDVAEMLKLPSAAKKPKERTRFTHIKQIALIAACALLLGAAIPIVNYILPRFGITVGGSAGAGSDSIGNETDKPNSEYLEWDISPSTTDEDFDIPEPEGGLDFIEHVGEVPAEFKNIIEQNLFLRAYVYGDILLRYVRTEDYHNFYFFDKSGNIFRKAQYAAENTYMHKTFIDSEGNLLVYFSVSYQDAARRAISYAKIVKFGTDGKLVFDTDIYPEKTGSFDHMLETDDGYIFAGSINIKYNGNRSRSDVFLVKLSDSGEVRKTVQIGTADEYDTVVHAEKTADGSAIYLCLQETPEGEAKAKWNYYRYDVSDDLLDAKQTAISEEDVPEDPPYFYINGKGFYSISDFISDYSYNDYMGSELIEYDDFVLFVGDRFTSDYDLFKDGVLSTIPITFWYRETVYAAYTKEGELIWRTAVDSTSYETIKEEYERSNEYQGDPITGDSDNIIKIPVETD